MKRYFKKQWVVLVSAFVLTLGLVQFLNGGLRFAGHSQHVSVTELTTSNLQQEISSAKGPVYIEFYSGKVADSKAELVILDDAAQHYGAKATFFSVNMDEQPQVAAAFAAVISQEVGQQLKSLPPTLHLMMKFDDQGNAQLMNVGAGLLPEQYLAKFIEDGLSGKALQAPQGAQQGQPDNNNGGGNGSSSGAGTGGTNGGTDPSTGTAPTPAPQKLAPQASAPVTKAIKSPTNKADLVTPSPQSDASMVLPGAKP